MLNECLIKYSDSSCYDIGFIKSVLHLPNLHPPDSHLTDYNKQNSNHSGQSLVLIYTGPFAELMGLMTAALLPLPNLGTAEPKLKDFLIKCKHFTRLMLSALGSPQLELSQWRTTILLISLVTRCSRLMVQIVGRLARGHSLSITSWDPATISSNRTTRRGPTGKRLDVWWKLVTQT